MVLDSNGISFWTGVPIYGIEQDKYSYVYDNKGNLSQKTRYIPNVKTTNFTKYNYRNLLLELNDPDPQIRIIKYKYDEQGNRISKVGKWVK